MTDHFDVLVVGAGPAGSTTAALLAGQGLRVLMVDRAHFPRLKTCAEFMSPGVAHVLHRLGAPDTIIEHALRIPGMEIVSPNGRRLRLEYALNGIRETALTLRRDSLDTSLVEWATERGVELREGVVAREPLFENGTVRGVRCSSAGQDMRLFASLTIIADGCRSSLASSLQLARSPRWPQRLGLVAHFEGTPELRDGFGQMCVAARGYCGIAPLPGEQVNVAMVVPQHALRAGGVSATTFFEQWIRDHPIVRDTLSRCRRISPVHGLGFIGARTSSAWAPGVMLAGDAAGFFDPFTGEGIHRALLSAEIAAGLGVLAVRTGMVGADTLGKYDQLRSDAFRWKHGVTALIQLFVQWPALLEYALPRLAERRAPTSTLSAVLGDLVDAREFLRPSMLWSALRP